jgi:hypothetical protein
VKGFADLGELPEDERIALIGETARECVIGFIVETNAKADRYVRKLLERFPAVRLVGRGPGPVANSILVRIGPRGH